MSIIEIYTKLSVNKILLTATDYDACGHLNTN